MQAAREAMDTNNYPEAVKALDEVIAQSPDNTDARFLKGLALARSGDIDAALDVFNKLTDDAPDMAEAWNNLGVLRARRNKLESAHDALREAVRLKPHYGPAQENLGDIHVALARNAYARAGEAESDNDSVKRKQQQLVSILNTDVVVQQTADNDEASSDQTAAADTSDENHSNQRADAENAVRDAVKQWAKAWSDQDVDAYLDAYQADFQPTGGKSHAAWAKQRRERVSSPASIDIDLSDMSVQFEGDDTAKVSFKQRYTSDTYQDQERKTLTLNRQDGHWRISDES